jgi:hypothetical protein
VKLNDIAHAFPAGHCIRLAISTSNWPIAWPSPENVTLTLSTGNSTLSLPERPPSASDEKAWPFGRPEAAPSIEPKKLRLFPLKRTVENDRTTNETIYTLESDAGEFGGASLARIEAIDMDAGYRLRRQHRIRETDPLSASTELSQEVVLRRSEWSVRVAVRTRLTSTRDHFRFEGELQAFEGDETVSERRWDLDIPRALV